MKCYKNWLRLTLFRAVINVIMIGPFLSPLWASQAALKKAFAPWNPSDLIFRSRTGKMSAFCTSQDFVLSDGHYLSYFVIYYDPCKWCALFILLSPCDTNLVSGGHCWSPHSLLTLLLVGNIYPAESFITNIVITVVFLLNLS